jgi:hypothetical protein
MERECSLSRSQEPNTCLYREPTTCLYCEPYWDKFTIDSKCHNLAAHAVDSEQLDSEALSAVGALKNVSVPSVLN